MGSQSPFFQFSKFQSYCSRSTQPVRYLLGGPLAPVVGSHGSSRRRCSALSSWGVGGSPSASLAAVVAIRWRIGAGGLSVCPLGQGDFEHASVVLSTIQGLHGGLGLFLGLKVHEAVVVGSSGAASALMGRDALANV